jgi:4-amino-4-deoxy-L-arabinose transferase-like glycosyltransferase
VPLPLTLLLVAAAVSGAAWSLLKPALQGPDENSHFTYTQRIVERQTIPWKPGGDNSRIYAGQTEIGMAQSAAGIGPLSANVAAKPLWTKPDETAWRAAAKGADRTRGGETTTFRNPPLYYLYEAIPYGIGYGGSFFDRLYLMRLANVVIYLVALVFVWLLAGELLGRGPQQVVATIAGAFIPQMLNIVATVNPDILLVAEYTAGFYVMVLLLRRGLSRPLLCALAGVCALAALTHGRGLPLLLPAGMTAVIALARARGWRRATPVRVAAGAWVMYLGVVLAWAAQGPKGYAREFLSYLWQFYLPRLSSMRPTIGPPGYAARQAWSDHLWGGLAHLEVLVPPSLGDALWLVSRLGLLAFVVVLVVRFRSVRRHSDVALVLASGALALLLALHLIAYRAMISLPYDPILTGRYLLPLVGLFGVAVALVVWTLPRPLRAPSGGAVAAGAVAIQLVMAGQLVERFYA